jgi:hypothetical protein
MSCERGRFTPKERDDVRERANGACEFPSCERPNNGIVHHITGCFEGMLKDVPEETIADVSMNSIMLCDLDTLRHDLEEKKNIEHIIYERRFNRRNQRRIKSPNKRGSHQKRR